MSLVTYLCLSIILYVQSSSSLPTDIEQRVYNGDGFRPEVHKYLVFLHISAGNQRFLCSGSIIDKQWVISAAHCFQKNLQVHIMQQHDLTWRWLGESRRVINHPLYVDLDGSTVGYDIALLKTNKPIQFDAFVQPIGLARIKAFGQKGIIAGYGKSEYEDCRPLEGTVEISRCKHFLEGSTTLCSQSKAYAGDGDSGGALTTSDGLVGVVSSTLELQTGIQTIFVDISSHFEWIEQITGKEIRVLA